MLNCLAGKLRTSGNMIVHREVKLDGVTIDPSSVETKRKISFVAQHDNLHSTSTVREAVRFSARMRSARGITDAQINTLVDRILEKLRLDSIADKLVGGQFSGQRLSGGEMRRVSLGIELVVRPRYVILHTIPSDTVGVSRLRETLKSLMLLPSFLKLPSLIGLLA